MARRRLGAAAARTLAASGPADAAELLAASPYRDRANAEDAATVGHGLAATALWNLRVLAGWQPARGVAALRLLAGWFEIANVDEHLQLLRNRPAEPPFQLGTLATAWPRLAATGSAEELRAVLAASPWGDPGGSTPREIQLGMRTRWGERVAASVPPANPWAVSAAAVLLASEHLASGRPLPASSAAAVGRLVGRSALTATSLDELRSTLPHAARWVLEDIAHPADLWHAEVRWWRRVEEDGVRMLGDSRFGLHRTVATAALLAVDVRRVRAALECAVHPHGDLAVFDAVA
jgi:hypothetical protein